jgi:biotin--protein ligase
LEHEKEESIEIETNEEDDIAIPLYICEGDIPDKMKEQLTFDYKKFEEYLRTKIFGRNFLYEEVTTSTQVILNDHFMTFRDVPNGVLFSAATQISAVGNRSVCCNEFSYYFALFTIGRGSNYWVSPPGCLMFSLQLIHNNLETAVFLQYLVSICIVDALKTKSKDHEQLDVHIKWPNDIYTSNGKKLGGILINNNYFENQMTLLIGKFSYIYSL